MSVRLFVESPLAPIGEAVAQVLARSGSVVVTSAATFEALGAASLLAEEPAPDAVVLILAARDGDLDLLHATPEAVHAAVTVPFMALVATARVVLDRWMEEGSAGELLFVIVSNAAREASILEASVRAFARSLAKEQSRRGVRPFVIVGSEAHSIAEAACMLTLTPLMVGETIVA